MKLDDSAQSCIVECVSRVALPIFLVGLHACAAAPTRTVGKPGAAQAAHSQPGAEPGFHRDADWPSGPEEDEASHRGPDDDASDEVVVRRALQPERPPHPLAGLSSDELEAMLLGDPASLGSMSIGRTNAGALFNAVRMPDSPLWTLVHPRFAWGTEETVAFLTRCIEQVNAQFPDTPPLYIGDLSQRPGGQLKRHLSHQSGRDVDLGFYYTGDDPWWARADERNLDLPRTWALVRAMITETDVERIFIDTAIQKLLREHALSVGEAPEWLDLVFGGPSSDERPIILHEDGHDTHIHVRFYNPVAQETGRRMYQLLIAHKQISPPTYYVQHTVRRGDTLGGMARAYNTTVSAIQKANGLRSTRIIAGRSYRIPRRGGVIPTASAQAIPARRLPPLGRAAAPDVAAGPER
jgi:murein endopeptidase